MSNLFPNTSAKRPGETGLKIHLLAEDNSAVTLSTSNKGVELNDEIIDFIAKNPEILNVNVRLAS